MTDLWSLVFGVGIGLLLGLVGGGGSILTVPILVYAIGLDVREATATSLVVVGVTALVGAIPHARQGRVVPRTALAFGGTGILGAFAGTWLNTRVAGPVILFLFGVLMLVVAARMAFTRKPGANRPEGDRAPRFRWPVLVAGLVVGVMTGFFGVGGGFLIVPALVLVLGFPMRSAVGTSLVIIAINSAAGALAHLGAGGVDVRIALLFIVGGFVGTTLGARLVGVVDEDKLARSFAGLVALVGVYLIGRNVGVLI